MRLPDKLLLILMILYVTTNVATTGGLLHQTNLYGRSLIDPSEMLQKISPWQYLVLQLLAWRES